MYPYFVHLSACICTKNVTNNNILVIKEYLKSYE